MNPETSPATTAVDEDTIRLTIWRLLGSGFAIGRFFSGKRGSGGGGEREVPVVYTEMDGGVHSSRAPRRISWGDVIVDEGIDCGFIEIATMEDQLPVV